MPEFRIKAGSLKRIHRIIVPIFMILPVLPTCLRSPVRPEKSLELRRIIDTSDTVSLFPILYLKSSSPIADTTVNVTFRPPSDAYYTRSSPGNDTIVVQVSGFLHPQTRYVIQLSHALHGTDGSVLYPHEDSLVIITGPGENEPNDRPGLADTLCSRRYGIISTSHDTDFFIVDADSVSHAYLRSLDGKAGLFCADSENRRIEAAAQGSSADTIPVSDSLVPPLYLGCFSSGGVAGIRYEIGILSPE